MLSRKPRKGSRKRMPCWAINTCRDGYIYISIYIYKYNIYIYIHIYIIYIYIHIYVYIYIYIYMYIYIGQTIGGPRSRSILMWFGNQFAPGTTFSHNHHNITNDVLFNTHVWIRLVSWIDMVTPNKVEQSFNTILAGVYPVYPFYLLGGALPTSCHAIWPQTIGNGLGEAPWLVLCWANPPKGWGFLGSSSQYLA